MRGDSVEKKSTRQCRQTYMTVNHIVAFPIPDEKCVAQPATNTSTVPYCIVKYAVSAHRHSFTHC